MMPFIKKKYVKQIIFKLKIMLYLLAIHEKEMRILELLGELREVPYGTYA